MIAVSDEVSRIKIYSITAIGSDKSKREYLSTIKKSDFVIPADLQEKLSPPDQEYLEQVIEIYKRAETVKQQATALSLPATLQTVLDYARASATERETDLILQAIEDARRSLLKIKSQQNEA